MSLVPENLRAVVAVAVGASHTCATSAEGLRPRGNDAHGQHSHVVENYVGLEVGAAATVTQDIQHTEPRMRHALLHCMFFL